MDKFLHFHLPNFRCKKATLALAFAYLSGLVLGSLISVQSGASSDFVSQTVIHGRISFAGLLSPTVLPLCFSAFAVYIGRHQLIIPIAFCKAFLFSYAGCGILLTFGTAGWLVLLLFMFSDILMLPMLWWYWRQVLEGRTGRPLQGLVPASTAGLAIGCLDYYLIAPFLANLLSY